MGKTKKSNQAALRISRSEAIRMLHDLDRSAIAGVTFVARGESGDGKPRLCTMSFRRGVGKQLKGGTLAYDPAEHGLMCVAEIVNRTTALKEYKAAAQRKIELLQPQIEPAVRALDQADAAYAAKPTKKNQNAAASKRKALSSVREKLAHARLVLADPAAALKVEIEKRISNRREEIAQLPVKLKDSPDELQKELEECRQRLNKELSYLQDPVQSLIVRYRMINLTGLCALTIAGVKYEVTTPPVPSLAMCTSTNGVK